MTNYNQFNATLPDDAYQQILQHIEAIESLLPFLVNCTNEDRKAFAKMGDKTLPFVGKSLDYTRNNYQLLPGFFNTMAFEQSMQLNQQLTSIYRPWRSLGEGLSDTIMLTGHHSYMAALDFYNLVKMAKEKNIPGMTSIYEDLKARFPGRKKIRSGKPPKNGAAPIIGSNDL